MKPTVPRHAPRAGVALVLLALAACGQSTDPNPTDLPAQAGVEALVAAFDSVPLVALAEAHGLQQEHDFLVRLVRHPGFARKANDIVVEFGNARYQAVMDRYVAGEAVPGAELRLAWRNTTQSPHQTWDAPVYERFFRTVRDVNRSLPAGRRLRVLLGDPPIDWSTVTRDQLLSLGFTRGTHLAGVVQREVLARGRKALIVAGGAHVGHRPPFNFPGGDPGMGGTAVQIIERAHPGSVFVAGPYLGFGPRSAELEPRIAPLQPHWLVHVPGTWVGDLRTIRDLGMAPPRGPDGRPIDPGDGPKLSEVQDGLLFLGIRGELTGSWAPPAATCGDAEYFAELKRRHQLWFAAPLDSAAYCAPRPPAYLP
jgi:hypothetical protein